jgi:alpha-galactosidase
LGIGGFGWLDEVKFEGGDLIPVFKKYAEKYYEVGYDFIGDERNRVSNKIKFDLFLRYGMIPAAPDAVAAEFCPRWYLRSSSVMAEWELKQANMNYFKKVKLDRLSRVKALMNGDESLNAGTSDTDCHLQIKALLGLGNLISNICICNMGQVENLPLGAIVHTNALLSRDSVKPVMAGKLTDELYGLTIRHTVNQSALVRAVFEKDLDIAFNAFLNDPLMHLDLSEAGRLYKEMLAAVRTQLLYYC